MYPQRFAQGQPCGVAAISCKQHVWRGDAGAIALVLTDGGAMPERAVERPVPAAERVGIADAQSATMSLSADLAIYNPNPTDRVLLDFRLRYRAIAQTGKNFG